jgi:hypothetical protein
MASFPVDLRRFEFHIAAIRLDAGEIIRISEPFGIGLGEAGQRLARIAPVGPHIDPCSRIMTTSAQPSSTSIVVKYQKQYVTITSSTQNFVKCFCQYLKYRPGVSSMIVNAKLI